MTRDEYMQMYAVVGAAMEVYNQLGRGMEEQIYQEALQRELSMRDIQFEPKKVLHTYYKGQQMDKIYEADLYINGIMVELKSVTQLHSEHRAQLFNYMRITHTHRGLLINFGEKSIRVERYLYQPEHDDMILLSESNLKQYIK